MISMERNKAVELYSLPLSSGRSSFPGVPRTPRGHGDSMELHVARKPMEELILRWLEGVPGSPGKKHQEGQEDQGTCLLHTPVLMRRTLTHTTQDVEVA